MSDPKAGQAARRINVKGLRPATVIAP